jgi:predicted ATP-dependent Lon-type protease
VRPLAIKKMVLKSPTRSRQRVFTGILKELYPDSTIAERAHQMSIVDLSECALSERRRVSGGCNHERPFAPIANPQR